MKDTWQKLLSDWEDRTARATRRAQGSIWTPAELAGWMADWVGAVDPRTVLDPGAGGGNLLAFFPGAQLTACDIDPELRAVLAARYPGVEALADFWALGDERRFDAIIANPPYINHSQIDGKEEIHRRITAATGVKLPRTTNLALLFYVWCWHLLADGGRMVFLMPTEFMQTKSGVAFKQFLLDHDAARAIVDLDDGGLFGDDVISTASLVLAEKSPRAERGIAFAQHDGRPPYQPWDEFIAQAKFLPVSDIRPERRWRPHHRSQQAGHATQPLRELCAIEPGLITGNNSYFLLSWPELQARGLQAESRYCLIRPHQLPTRFFHTPEQIDALKATGQARWLVDIGAVPSPAARAYLDEGEADEVHKRPTQAARDPWWIQQAPAQLDFLIGNFRREDYLVMACTTSEELLARVQHACIPNLVRMHDQFRALAPVLFGWLISESGQQALRAHERHAGNGLYTIRSGALKQVEAPLLQDAPESWLADMNAAVSALREASLGTAGTLAQAKSRLDAVAASLN